MRFLTLFLLVVATVEAAEKRTFTLNLKREEGHYGKETVAKQNKLSRMMNKFGKVFTEAINFYKLSTIKQANSNDYFAEISFGPDAQNLQTFRVLIDTGSYGTWVPARECTTSAYDPKHCKGADGTQPQNSVTYNTQDRSLTPGFRATYDFNFQTQSGEWVEAVFDNFRRIALPYALQVFNALPYVDLGCLIEFL